MWPNRLPSYYVQPQTNYIPVQIPLQSAYVPQPFITNQVITNPFTQQKIIYQQPFQYRPVLNSVVYPSGVQYLPYSRPGSSHLTGFALKQHGSSDDSKDYHTTPSELENCGTGADETSVSSHSSNLESPSLEHVDLPIVIQDPSKLNDFTTESARFYNAFYKVCCEGQDSSNSALPNADTVKNSDRCDNPLESCIEPDPVVLEQKQTESVANTVNNDVSVFSPPKQDVNNEVCEISVDSTGQRAGACSPLLSTSMESKTVHMDHTNLALCVVKQGPVCQLPL